jgi:hypothetical protein
LPTDARWPMASASVFTVTVPSIQRELCARGVGVPASSWSTRGLTSGTKLASRAPSPRVQVNWRPGTDHQPHEPVKNDGWAPPKHPASAGLVLESAKAARPDGPAVGVGCRNRDKIPLGSSQPVSWRIGQNGCLSHPAAFLLVCGGWPFRSGLGCLGCELDPGRHAQLAEDVGEMGFHCAPGDEQAPTDLDVGESLTHQPYHLELGGSETFPSPRGSPASPSSASADT